jgi:hypothetical protein
MDLVGSVITAKSIYCTIPEIMWTKLENYGKVRGARIQAMI